MKLALHPQSLFSFSIINRGSPPPDCRRFRAGLASFPDVPRREAADGPGFLGSAVGRFGRNSFTRAGWITASNRNTIPQNWAGELSAGFIRSYGLPQPADQAAKPADQTAKPTDETPKPADQTAELTDG